MSRKADCWDNAPMESFFGSMKTELDDASGYQTRQAARTELFRSSKGSTIATACTRQSATSFQCKRNN